MMSELLYVALLLACAAGGLLGLAGWVWRPAAGLRRAGDLTGFVCLATSCAAWLLRWGRTGHLPLFGTYESSLSLAVAVLASAWITWRRTRLPLVWPIACGVGAALLSHGLGFDHTAYPLTISETSWVVEIHAILAWATFGCLAANAGLGVAWLLGREAGDARVGRLLGSSLSLGFVLHSAMLASGSFYKFLLFGEAWSFDPIETMGFVTWMSYGTLLHLHLMAGWEGRRLAAWCVGLFLMLTVSFRSIVYFPAWSSYHILDMDLRIHVSPSAPATTGGGQ
jgi:ABC-type uncharacterized transport system permease subunit